MSYGYNEDGIRLTLTYADGTVLATSYTGRNQVKDIIVVGPPPPISYTYDTAGNRVGRSLENGTITAYSYDDAGRLASLEHKIGGVSLQRFDYTLNAQGSRTARVESNNSVAQTDVYTYDPSEQITQVKYNYNAGTGTQDREVNYAYDAVGNRTAVTDNGTPTPYTANSLNQYMAIDAFAAPACDGNGNLTTLQSAVGAPVWTYNYDAQNRLTGGVSTSGDTFTFAYDPRNRCVVRTVGGTATCYLYDDWNVIEDRSAADLQVAQYYQGAAVDEVIAAVNPNGTFFHHHDGLGSVTAVTDATGAIAERVRYDVFGAPSFADSANQPAASSPTGNRFLFTGRELLPAGDGSTIYDYRNRDYFPLIGRFAQPDPLGFDSGDENLVRYVQNNPATTIDPLGLWHTGAYARDDASTIICDGHGKVIYHPPKPVPAHDVCCLPCFEAHENSHAEDAMAANPIVCVGKQRNIAVGFSNLSEQKRSELMAHGKEKKCLENLLKDRETKKSCLRDITARLKRVNEVYIPTYNKFADDPTKPPVQVPWSL